MPVKSHMVSVRSTAPELPPEPTGDTLWDRFTYVGSVRMPHFVVEAGSTDRSFANMRHLFAYDGGSDTFLIGCHDGWKRRVIRISLPTPVPHLQDGTTTGLPVATVLMSDWVDITDGMFSSYDGGTVSHATGNVVIHDSKVWWVMEPGYNTSGSTHPVLGHSDNTADLTALNGVTPWSTNVHYKQLCRCITVIPEAWATANVSGKRFLMGCAGISGDAKASYGPALIAVQKPTAPGQTLTTQHISFFHNVTGAAKWFWPDNGAEFHHGQHVESLQWIEDGSDHWVIATGFRYFPPYSYKGLSPCASQEQGFWGYPHEFYWMTYHADDFLPVIAGTITPQELVPREIVRLGAPLFIRDSACYARHEFATAWDPVRKRMWIMESKGYEPTAFSDIPVLHALDLDAA